VEAGWLRTLRGDRRPDPHRRAQILGRRAAGTLCESGSGAETPFPGSRQGPEKPLASGPIGEDAGRLFLKISNFGSPTASVGEIRLPGRAAVGSAGLLRARPAPRAGARRPFAPSPFRSSPA